MNNFSASVIDVLPNIVMTFPLVGELNLSPYIAALAIFIGLSVFFKIIQVVVIGRLHALSQKTKTDVDDVLIDAVKGIRAWVYTLVAFYVSLQFFSFPEIADRILTGFVYFAVAWQVIEIALCFVEYGAGRFLEKDEDNDGVIDPNTATASHMLTLIARIVLWALGGLFVLSNMGIEVTSLIAGLGIGGVAVAFALQGILSDLFASFSLYFDKPFRIGDYIVIGDDSGTVEKIGIKSTRIRTLQGEELVVSNAELTSTRVQNFKKMQRRRIVTQFGITYETPHQRVRETPGVVTRILESIDGASLDRVHFTTFGDFALMFEIVYYVESSDYAVFMDLQQQFNLELMDKFSELGIEFAYPTQVQYVKRLD